MKRDGEGKGQNKKYANKYKNFKPCKTKNIDKTLNRYPIIIGDKKFFPCTTPNCNFKSKCFLSRVFNSELNRRRRKDPKK